MTRRSVRAATVWLARGLDSWFGDRPFEDGGEVTRGRLGFDLLWRQREGVDPRIRFDARVRLPNLEERAYLFIGRDNTREVVSDRPGELTARERLLEEARQERSFFAGLALPLLDIFEFRLGVRAREKLFAHLRYTKEWRPSERDLVTFRETLFWTLDERFGSTTALYYEHQFSPVLAARWVNAATISQDSDRFEWSSRLGLFRLFAASRIVSLEGVLTGNQGSGVPIDEYGAQVKYQQPVYKEWLIGELTTGHFWPRSDPVSERGRRWAVGAGLRMLF